MRNRFNWCLLLGIALAGALPGWGSAAEESGNEKQRGGGTTEVLRGDAISDPLLVLLRTPAIRRELALDARQIELVDREIAKVNDSLWRLRDAQLSNDDDSFNAWQFIDQVEAQMGKVLKAPQHARLRQLVLQARGLDALVTPYVIEALRLSPAQVRQIGDGLEAILSQSLRGKQSPGKDDAEERRQAADSVIAWRKKVVGVLSHDQEQRLQRLAGPAFSFAGMPRRFARAPEIRGVTQWINSSPTTLAGLRGKVVAVHFFTFGCINCVHNQPAFKNWHERFQHEDVVVLGIHTPETEGEHKLENVRKALQDQGITYPVAVDNAKENWNAWANNMWPSVYLIDKDGYVRCWWYGELYWQGAQGEHIFRERIAELLAEKPESAPGAVLGR